MNTHKLFNRLVVLSVLLSVLLVSSPTPAEAAPVPPHKLDSVETPDIYTPFSGFSGFSAASDSAASSLPSASTAVSGEIRAIAS